MKGRMAVGAPERWSMIADEGWAKMLSLWYVLACGDTVIAEWRSVDCVAGANMGEIKEPKRSPASGFGGRHDRVEVMTM